MLEVALYLVEGYKDRRVKKNEKEERKVRMEVEQGAERERERGV